MMRDDIVGEIHAHRSAVSDRFGGDLARMLEYYESLDAPIPVRQSKAPGAACPVRARWAGIAEDLDGPAVPAGRAGPDFGLRARSGKASRWKNGI